jgi:hypothetical protein
VTFFVPCYLFFYHVTLKIPCFILRRCDMMIANILIQTGKVLIGRLRLLCYGGALCCANRVNQSSPPKKTDSASSGAGACFLIMVLPILVCSKLNFIYSIANRHAASGRVLRRGRRFRSRGRCSVVVYKCFV